MTKLLTGTVVTNSALNTSVVEVSSWKTHRLFHKRYRTTARYLVENTGNQAQIGQTVTIMPCRPISKRKSWKIVSPVEEPTKKETAKPQSSPKKVK